MSTRLDCTRSQDGVDLPLQLTLGGAAVEAAPADWYDDVSNALKSNIVFLLVTLVCYPQASLIKHPLKIPDP